MIDRFALIYTRDSYHNENAATIVWGFLSDRVYSGIDVFIRAIENSKLWYHAGTVVGMEPFIDWYRSLSAVHFE